MEDFETRIRGAILAAQARGMTVCRTLQIGGPPIEDDCCCPLGALAGACVGDSFARRFPLSVDSVSPDVASAFIAGFEGHTSASDTVKASHGYFVGATIAQEFGL